MNQVVLGTAGHIDHGKTSLIRALTGIDTDRLKEEKQRGITIELGFAYLDLPDGSRLGIVDVPGHERFVKHMVAGASGIDLVALVVAADEGVMPQTREHLEICQLLRVKEGLVVLTKIDMVDDPDWIDMVEEDVREFLQGTFLDGASVVKVSAVTGEGMDELKKVLLEKVAQVPGRSQAGPFRLSIDRVFTMRGFGTVVTGTSLSGKLRVGDPVTIYPSGIKTKVRGLQVHNQDVQEVFPGQRTAINLQGVDRETVQRGEVLATPDSLLPSYMLDVSLDLLPSAPKPLKDRQKIRFHTGTMETVATLILLDRQELSPGESAFAQVRLDRPLAVLRGDRFVLRSYSPIRTLGGGEILHPVPKKHKGKDKAQAAASLGLLQSGSESEILLWHVLDAGWTGVSEAELKIRSNVMGKAFRDNLARLVSQKAVLLYDKESRRYIHPDVLRAVETDLLKVLDAYHRKNPLKAGMPKEEVSAQMERPIDPKLLGYVFRQLSERGELVQEKEVVRLTSHKVDLTDDEKKIRDCIEEIYRKAWLQPPFFKVVVEDLPGNSRQHKDVLEWMLAQKTLVKVKEDLFFHRKAIEDLKERLVGFLKEHQEISAAQFKEMTQASRKYTIPLLEYFDGQRVTIRVGDVRRLRETKNG
ncbi:selenocysteine-specific translation elongation factor SelB [Desulfacinum hydrothermale DSM 13146]|uniref:Selenocysteine-specific elongation factor n=1 Tax=Desulfacinum hydrothermale DSM 13146 TaxID=1121390 RepID=A0A1W1X5U3_9BACT|nr:selenocysteine-specific translation elongation factor [Desulfacinum hydrothermale]SMC19088.1 selenocysteine-specific translation elongation factor SelB [Desulfacinum hydrothermale DSM 13146]